MNQNIFKSMKGKRLDVGPILKSSSHFLYPCLGRHHSDLLLYGQNLGRELWIHYPKRHTRLFNSTRRQKIQRSHRKRQDVDSTISKGPEICTDHKFTFGKSQNPTKANQRSGLLLNGLNKFEREEVSILQNKPQMNGLIVFKPNILFSFPSNRLINHVTG